ncbi:MAG: LOG family protein [Pseudoclavibacter sp.]
MPANADLVERILADGVGVGQDGADRLDLKIASTALAEMREAFSLFAQYRGRPKVTVFGSARTQPDDVIYGMTRAVASRLADRGWMVVTGAGPGVMRAAAEGAGDDHSIGVSIRLPFEAPNPTFADAGNLVTMKYFFTRKLMLVKESKGFVCVPGGFGTLDELFELLTLQQTGKGSPTPIVLLDRPVDAQDAATDADGGRTHPVESFWSGLRRFADEQLIPSGVISADDLDRVLITDSVDAAVEEISGFWRNYDSLRWVGSRLILRLRAEPTDAELAQLNRDFRFLSPELGIVRTHPLRPEVKDQDRLSLPRLALQPSPRQIGRLHQLIRAVNALPSAPATAPSQPLSAPMEARS